MNEDPSYSDMILDVDSKFWLFPPVFSRKNRGEPKRGTEGVVFVLLLSLGVKPGGPVGPMNFN